MGIFGKDNTDLLHQILRELGELRQQVTSQQHAIDQARQDTNAAITTGLAEIRSVTREGLARTSTELASTPAVVNDLGRSAPATTEGADRKQPHQNAAKLLTAAAGISSAELQMHRDAWSFLVEHAAGDRHFHVPGAVQEQDGKVTVHVSGPSIVAALTTLDRVSRTDDEPGTRAIADHLHQRFTDTVQQIIKDPHRGDGVDPVRIVIDDRAKPANDDQE